MKKFFGKLAYLNHTMKKASEITGISYSRILRMKKLDMFSARDLDRICSAYGFTVEDLLSFEEE